MHDHFITTLGDFMSESEARDAYVGVEVPLPNGKTVTGKPIPYPEAMGLLVLSEQFLVGEAAPSTSIIPALQQFETLTGITGERLKALCPDISLGEVIDIMQRFFYWRRTAPTVAPPSLAPSPPAPPSGA